MKSTLIGTALRAGGATQSGLPVRILRSLEQGDVFRNVSGEPSLSSMLNATPD
jgi:hypothetical protein